MGRRHDARHHDPRSRGRRAATRRPGVDGQLASAADVVRGLPGHVDLAARTRGGRPGTDRDVAPASRPGRTAPTDLPRRRLGRLRRRPVRGPHRLAAPSDGPRPTRCAGHRPQHRHTGGRSHRVAGRSGTPVDTPPGRRHRTPRPRYRGWTAPPNAGRRPRSAGIPCLGAATYGDNTDARRLYDKWKFDVQERYFIWQANSGRRRSRPGAPPLVRGAVSTRALWRCTGMRSCWAASRC